MNTLDKFAPHAHWLLRFALASVFLYHGLTKFPNLEGMASMMQMPVFLVALLALMETAAGVLVLLGGALKKGLLTRLGGLIVVPVMLGAIALVHWGQWGFAPSETHPMGGMEFQVTLLLIGAYFALVGNGRPGAPAPAPPQREASYA